MRRFYSTFKTILYMCLFLLGVTMSDGVAAIAQDTGGSRPLDRVEINPPEQRRPARATSERSSSSEGMDQASSTQSSSSQEQGASSGTAAGIPGPASTLSTITGKSQVSIGSTSLPGQVQVETARDIRQLNFWGDYSAYFTRIPGVKSVGYGQGLLGAGISIRGFNMSEGVAIFIDGVPQNFPSHSGATGKSEISWLAPEEIERIDIIKGPVSALYGDFALAGVVNIVTKKSEASSSLTSSGGSFSSFRSYGVLSRDTLVPTPYVTLDYYNIQGYRDNSQINWVSPFNKLSMPVLGGILSVRYNYFQADWGAPGYWPIDWVKAGLVERTSAFNTTDGGYQGRYEAVMNYAPACGERGLYATLYTENYHMKRFGTFSGPTFATRYSSSQFCRQDDRNHWGGRVFYNLVFGDVGSLIAGGETRQDSAEAQQYNTIERQRTTTTYDYDMRLANWAMFLQGQFKPAEYLKIVGGVRWDYFKQSYGNLALPKNSGTGFPYIQSPKIGFVMTPTSNLNIFGNAATGLRSPSALEVSPYKANSQADFTLEPAAVQTYDLGFNVSLYGNLYLAADYYHTYMQREIRMVNNNPVVIGDTVRKGYELEASFYPTNSTDFKFFGSYGWVDAKVTDPVTAGQVLVPEVSEHTIKGGLTVQKDFGSGRNILADLYYQYTSGAPYYRSLTKTAAALATPIYGPDADVYNFKLTYTGNGWSSFFSARCRPREYSSDYTWVSNDLLVYDPPPKWELASGLTYSW